MPTAPFWHFDNLPNVKFCLECEFFERELEKWSFEHFKESHNFIFSELVESRLPVDKAYETLTYES